MPRSCTEGAALLVLNDWLDRRVRLLVLVRNGAPRSALPPSGPAQGWHVLLGREGVLSRPRAETDWERELAVGTYELGNDKLMLAGLPCEQIMVLDDQERPASGLAFYLPAFSAVLLLQRLAVS